MIALRSTISCFFGARASIHTSALVCTSGCSELFGIARVIQALCLQSTKFLVAESISNVSFMMNEDTADV